MSAANAQCTMCHGELEDGYIAHWSNNGRTAINWSGGSPKARFFGKGLRSGGTQDRTLSALRCVNCGHVEFFAN
ncbi:MAG: PF20097 family protein [Gordonia sp. (in: high G+C Gram-positive bacteria)]|uniref:PF20097 family protein n=1 Tax=Gordonia sp. (in: high G+C Gram-positive bacteria) TaxID=84139 RepID=UPI0039E3DF1E